MSEEIPVILKREQGTYVLKIGKITDEILRLEATMADVAVTKHHQRLDELLIFFTCTIQKISKLFRRKRCQKRIHL